MLLSADWGCTDGVHSIRFHRRVEGGYEVANLWSGLSSTQPYRRHQIALLVRTRGLPELYGWGSLHPLPTTGINLTDQLFFS